MQETDEVHQAYSAVYNTSVKQQLSLPFLLLIHYLPPPSPCFLQYFEQYAVCLFLLPFFFYCFFSIFLPLQWTEREFICPTDICYKVTQFRQHLEAAEGEHTATGPLDNKFLPFCIIKNE